MTLTRWIGTHFNKKQALDTSSITINTEISDLESSTLDDEITDMLSINNAIDLEKLEENINNELIDIKENIYLNDQKKSIELIFKAVMISHLNWKKKLHASIEDGSIKDLSNKTISNDDQCAFGQWLREEGQIFSKVSGFDALVHTHTQFHQCSGHVVELVKNNNKAAALKQLTHGHYANIAKEMIKDLNRLYINILKNSSYKNKK